MSETTLCPRCKHDVDEHSNVGCLVKSTKPNGECWEGTDVPKLAHGFCDCPIDERDLDAYFAAKPDDITTLAFARDFAREVTPE